MPWAYSHILLCPQSFSFFTRKTPKLVSPKPSKAWSNSTGRYTNLSWLTSNPLPTDRLCPPPPPLSHTLSPNCKRCSFKFLIHYLLFNFIFLLLFSFFHFHFIIKIFAQVIAHLGLSAPWLLCPQKKAIYLRTDFIDSLEESPKTPMLVGPLVLFPLPRP